MSEAPEIPANLRPYVDVLGIEGAIEFLLAFGGAPLYLAAQPQARSRVVDVVGVENAKALADRFGVGQHRIPVGKQWIARRLHQNGVSVYEIARRLHMTDTTIRKFVRVETRQMSLF